MSKVSVNFKSFTVEGTGSFPVDMLRYDMCWPKTEAHESVAIPNSFHERNIGAPWRITLVTVKDTAPTVDRWASFGWKVV